MIIHVILCFWHPIVLNLMLSIYVIIYENHVLTFFITRTNDVMITSFLCQPNVAMSFWCINDVIMTLCVRWEYVLLSFKFTVSLRFFSQTGSLDCSGVPLKTDNEPYWEEHQLLTASSSVACGWTVWFAGLLVCWQLFDVATEFHGDGRGVPLNQNASKIHIKVYR